MPSDNVYGSLYNADSVAISNGMVIRVSANNRGVRAQSDSAANVRGLAGVNISGIIGIGGPMNVANAAFSQKVLLETGLTPAAGDALYVSDTVAGRATNVAPALAVTIGSIEDVSSYALDSRVTAIVEISSAPASSFAPAIDTVASVNAAAPSLVAFDSSASSESDLVWARTVGAYFQLRNNTAVPLVIDNLTVVQAAGLPVGWQWVRLNIMNRSFEAQTVWNIDPSNVTGTASDENDGLTAGTSLVTYREHARRMFDCFITSAVTVTVRSNFVPGDEPSYNFRTPQSGGTVTFDGVPTVIYGPATVSAVSLQATTAAADDNRFTDATIPVSFTASGILADGVLLQRTSDAIYAWAAKDLGGAAPAATLRTSNWYTLGGSLSNVLTNGDTYTASTLPTCGALKFPCITRDTVMLRFLDLSADLTTSVSVSYQRLHCAAIRIPGITHRNPGIFFTAGGSSLSSEGAGISISGMFRGNGGVALQISSAGRFTIAGPTFQGVGPQVLGSALLAITSRMTVHDTTAAGLAMLTCIQGGEAVIVQSGCLGGMGNTQKIINVGEGSGAFRTQGRVRYSVATPFVAGSTTDPSPITINNTSYSIAQILGPGQTDSVDLSGSARFPGNNYVMVANGGQTVVIGATGPNAISDPSTPAGWETFRNGSGQICYRPFWV